uniref:Uncharacterized protein n=1 Tax=Anguilla anguilla TaxID=7936 RepID=A0A0E9RXM2_ANGAN
MQFFTQLRQKVSHYGVLCSLTLLWSCVFPIARPERYSAVGSQH